MMYTRSKLANDFRQLGVKDGDTIMLHASVRAVGPIAGGADQIHLALKDALTERGTLVMYASCPEYVDEVGRGVHSQAFEADILRTLPAYDAQTARSDRSNGALVEMLRTYPGSIVNDHVVRFTAWGLNAQQLLGPQPWNYAFGRDSVLHRLLDLDAKILMLGSDHDTVTFLHHTETVVDIPGKRVVRFKVPLLENGARVWREMEEYDSSRGAHASWTERYFAELVDAFLDHSRNAGRAVGDAPAYIMNARDLHAFALEYMKRTVAEYDAERRG